MKIKRDHYLINYHLISYKREHSLYPLSLRNEEEEGECSFEPPKS